METGRTSGPGAIGPVLSASAKARKSTMRLRNQHYSIPLQNASSVAAEGVQTLAQGFISLTPPQLDLAAFSNASRSRKWLSMIGSVRRAKILTAGSEPLAS